MAEDPKCDKVTFFKPSNRVGGVATSGPCDSEKLKVPQELKEPKDTQPSFEPAPTLRLLRLGNRRQVLRCAEQFIETVKLPDGTTITYPSEGKDVVVEAGAFTSSVDLTGIQELSEQAIAYIVTSDGITKLEEAISYTQDIPAAVTLALILRIKMTQAEQLHTMLQLRLEMLDASAVNAGRAQLSCLWWNDTQKAVCSDTNNDAYASEEEDPEAVNLAVVIEKTVSSKDSKTTANTIAYQQALAALNCFYLSDPITVSCTTRPGRPLPTMELVPVDSADKFKEEYGEAPNFDELLPRVGRVSVARGTFKSSVSKDDANSLAEQYALAQLVCYYLSQEVILKCNDPEARSQGEDPRYTEAREADPVEGIPGQLVRIPAGYFTSDISTSEATAMAEALASALLECCFINDEQLYTCPEDADPDKSPVYSYFVPRGTFESCTSKEEVEAIARASAEGALVCEYCNGLVLPSCVPAWVLSAVTVGYVIPPPPEGAEEGFSYNGRYYTTGDVFFLDLPLDTNGLIDPTTRTLVDLSSWSEDATRGMGASLICGADKTQVDRIAENAARLPVYVDESGSQATPTCRFKSTRHLIGCAFPDPFNPAHAKKPVWTDAAFGGSAADLYNAYAGSEGDFLEAPTPYKYKARTPDTQEAYVYYATTPYRNISVEYSSPTPGDYLDFPEGLITMTAADLPNYSSLAENLSLEEAERLVKEYADACVLQMGLGMLECNYKNPETVIACRYEPSFPTRPQLLSTDDYRNNRLTLGDPSAPYWWFGIGSEEDDAYLMPENLATIANPVIIPSGAIVGKDYAEIKTRIFTMATSLLKCQYTNRRVTCANRTGSKICGCDPHIKVALSTDGYAIEKGTVVAATVNAATQKALNMLLCPGDSMCLCCNEGASVTSYLAGGSVPDEDCTRTKSAPPCMFTASTTAAANAVQNAYLSGASLGGLFKGKEGKATCSCGASASDSKMLTAETIDVDGALFSAPCEAVRDQMKSAFCAALCANSIYINIEVTASLKCELKSSCFEEKSIEMQMTLGEGMITSKYDDANSTAQGYLQLLLAQACALWQEAFSVFECTELCVLTDIMMNGGECPNGTSNPFKVTMKKRVKNVSVVTSGEGEPLQLLSEVSMSEVGTETTESIPIYDTAETTAELNLSDITLEKTFYTEQVQLVTASSIPSIKMNELAWSQQSILSASGQLIKTEISTLQSPDINGLQVTVDDTSKVTFWAYNAPSACSVNLMHYTAIADLSGLSISGGSLSTEQVKILDPENIYQQSNVWMVTNAGYPILSASGISALWTPADKNFLTDVSLSSSGGNVDVNVTLKPSGSVTVLKTAATYTIVPEYKQLAITTVGVLTSNGGDPLEADMIYCCEMVKVFKTK